MRDGPRKQRCHVAPERRRLRKNVTLCVNMAKMSLTVVEDWRQELVDIMVSVESS